MMMQMLEAGGLGIVTDNIRKPDEDNPRGYYEFERVKKIKEDKSWLDECRGKAVKMVSMLLYDLPLEKKYKIIFMKREMEEMLASQRVMLERLGQKGGDVSDEEMGKKFEKHLRQVEEWLAKQENIDVLYVKYNDVLNDSQKYAEMVSKFLGRNLNVEKMANVIERSLYRQRKDNGAKGMVPK
ncbi:MAG: sulfotransferase family protein [Deltaproteobacteria bacterium]|nr:MAG: sulfotransferase family protein [Deltaproteobacteria bacterium]